MKRSKKPLKGGPRRSTESAPLISIVLGEEIGVESRLGFHNLKYPVTQFEIKD